MLDLLRTKGPGEVALALVGHLWFFAVSAFRQSLVALAMLVGVLAVAGSLRYSSWKANAPVVNGCLACSAAFLIFFSLVGLEQHRLAYSAVPPIVVAVAALTRSVEKLLPATRRRLLAATLGAIAVTQGCVTVLKDPDPGREPPPRPVGQSAWPSPGSERGAPERQGASREGLRGISAAWCGPDCGRGDRFFGGAAAAGRPARGGAAARPSGRMDARAPAPRPVGSVRATA